LYDTFYTERYLGNPTTDPKSYETSNALADAGKISDPLLILHGLSDDNVVFENSTALISSLQQQKRPFELMVYPGAAHSVPGEANRTHVWLTITRFLDRTVKNRP
jgi:dipeptidyl-peptidase 4